MPPLALEMQHIAYAAAEPVRPGDTIRRQLRRAWEALGKPPYWRVRAAWYGEAGCWSGAAIEDFRMREASRREERVRREEAARAKALALGAVYATAAERLAAIDPDFHRDDVAALQHAARRLGAPHSAVAGDVKS